MVGSIVFLGGDRDSYVGCLAETESEPEADACHEKGDDEERGKSKEVKEGSADDGDEGGDAEHGVGETDVEGAFAGRGEIEQISGEGDVGGGAGDTVEGKDEGKGHGGICIMRERAK